MAPREWQSSSLRLEPRRAPHYFRPQQQPTLTSDIWQHRTRIRNRLLAQRRKGGSQEPLESSEGSGHYRPESCRRLAKWLHDGPTKATHHTLGLYELEAYHRPFQQTGNRE